MTHRYLPITDADREEMLSSIGVRSVDDLFADIPESVRFKRALNLPAGMSEPELLKHMLSLANQNQSLDQVTSYLGAGIYEHFSPAIIGQILSLPEFYTAYTPYQAEISQGTLTAIFEYQSMMCAITGMDVSNASLYDGGTAVSEAVLMACEATGRDTVIIPDNINPFYMEVLRTYVHNRKVNLKTVPFKNGTIDLAALESMVDETVAGVVVQHPNFFGCLEPVDQISALIHSKGGLYIAVVDPMSLGVLKAPAEYGADIVVGEGQSLGLAPGFGGPLLGFMTTTSKLIRRMPGRIIGQTHDASGRTGYVLTLQTREQHIRRERATSNICSNEALCALAATIYLATIGPKGLKEVGYQSTVKAHYVADRLQEKGYKLTFNAPFFQEFALSGVTPAQTKNLLKKGILSGVDLGFRYPELKGNTLWAVTEVRTRAELDNLVAALEVH